jgi:hypothetical protein
MKKLAALLMCSLVAAPAMAGEDSTDRYWGYGPAWYETNCGLACFRLWERSGRDANDVSAAALKRLETPAQMGRLIEPPH